MGKHNFIKPEPPHVRGPCVLCGIRQQKNKGKQGFGPLCCHCHDKKYRPDRNSKRYKPYRKHLKDKCEQCGFIPIHMCQLDIDHIDGNHFNNDVSNLRTLCPNCHRLKTFLSKDWL